MDLNDLRLAFNRALLFTFGRKKLFLVSCMLFICGMLVIFCRGLAVHAGQWVMMSLTFLPVFLCAGVLLSTGVLLTRIYHDEVKSISTTYREVISKSWDVVIGTSYLFIPIILTYLLLWMVLGIFYALQEIPIIGDFFKTVFAFGPFLLNLGSLLLCVASVMLLFSVTPLFALKARRSDEFTHIIIERIRLDVFGNLLLMVVALAPSLVVGGILMTAGYLSASSGIDVESVLHVSLEWFFMMIPFVALLSPAIVFFFNFAAESHVLMHRKVQESLLT